MKKPSACFLMTRLVALVMLLFLVPQTTAALSIIELPPGVNISAQINEELFTQEYICLDQDCAFVFGPGESSNSLFFELERAHEQGKEESSLHGYVSHERGSIRIESYIHRAKEHVPLDEAALVEALDVLIEDDISDIKPLLLSTIEQWEEARTLPLTIAHRESEKGQALKARKNELALCSFIEYEEVGDWLVTEGYGEREYCHRTKEFNPFGNTDVTVRHSHFLFFLFTHIHEIPARYLVGLIVMTLGVLALGYHLVKRGEVWLFLKPTKTKIAITITVGAIITLLFLVMFTGLFSRPDGGHFAYVVRTWIVEYLIEIYLLSCLIGYIRYRRKTARAAD